MEMTMRVLQNSECIYVGGGWDMGSDTSGDYGNFGDSEGASVGYSGNPCTPADTAESCASRTYGYQLCEGFGNAIAALASRFGIAAETVAAQIATACQTGVDNAVNAAFRTQMYEQANPVSYSVGNETSSN
jgi:hypothetical protein